MKAFGLFIEKKKLNNPITKSLRRTASQPYRLSHTNALCINQSYTSISMKRTKGFHMRQRLFLHYGWFLQNLEKGFIRTNMHTTVDLNIPLIWKLF